MPLPAKELSAEDFATAKKEFLGLIRKRDPKFALSKLREGIKTDNALQRSCHPLVHEMGRVAYEKYGDFGKAMAYQDEICNSGYLHGIIESHFSKSPDILTSMKSVCDPYPLYKYLSWECFHGVGHGVMYYTSNDLSESLKLCGKFNNPFASSNCSNGVFMENFNSDQKLHGSKFLKKDDPFYPCREQASVHKDNCYLYAPVYYLSLHKNDYTATLDWCRGSEKDYQDTCIYGVGSQIMKENINNPELVEKICMSNGLSQTAPCIQGMIGLYINHYGSLDPAETVCGKLKITNRKHCYKTVTSYSNLF